MSMHLKISTAEIDALAASLGQIDAETLGAAAVTAVNTVADSTYADAVVAMTSTINLTPSYVEERLYLDPATSTHTPVAHVYAPKGGGRGATLGTYGAEQLVTPVRFDNNDPRIAAGQMGENPRKAGALLPWKKRTGDRQRGIPVGLKAAGVSVEVTRGQRKNIKSAFLAPLANGRLLPAVRIGESKKLRVLHGPSVWQLFRVTLNNMSGKIKGDLRTELVHEATRVLRKVLP